MSGQDRASVILLFDLGNILVRLNSVARLWPQADPAVLAVGEHLWSQSQAVRDYETGVITDYATFRRASMQELACRVSPGDFDQVYRRVIGALFDETESLLSTLKRHYPLMMLSNTSPLHRDICLGDLGLARFFAHCFISCEIGAMKPDPAIYRTVLTRTQHDPANIWFFDDRQENVDMAINLGFNAHLSFGGYTLINDLRHYGFLDEPDYTCLIAKGKNDV
jgi:putative hydrolase of the HAD superfamily